jgi:hypothetical protein
MFAAQVLLIGLLPATLASVVRTPTINVAL